MIHSHMQRVIYKLGVSACHERKERLIIFLIHGLGKFEGVGEDSGHGLVM